MNVAPHWIVYDSFGFPKIGLKGGGTDGPLSPPPPPVPILPATEKSEQDKGSRLLASDLESATSSHEAPIVVAEVVELTKAVEEVGGMEGLMDPLATTSTSEMSEVVVPALREEPTMTKADEMMVNDQMLMDLPGGGEMETLEMFHLVEVPEVTEVDMISPRPIDGGGGGKMAPIHDPIELVEERKEGRAVAVARVEADPLMPETAAVADPALEIGAGAKAQSSPSIASSDPVESSLVKSQQFDPSVIPKSESLPDVILNEEVEAVPVVSAAESQEQVEAPPVATVSAPTVQDPVVPETEKPTPPVEAVAVAAAPPTVSTPAVVVPSVSLSQTAVTLASKVSLKAPVSYSSSPSSMSTTVTTVTLSAIPVSNVPPSAQLATPTAIQSNPQPNVTIPMTSVRTVSVPGTVPTSILVRAPMGNRLSSPLIINQRPLPTLTLNSSPAQNPPPSANQPKATLQQQQQQQQTVVLVKQEKVDEEPVAAQQSTSESSANVEESSNPLLVQQQQQVT